MFVGVMGGWGGGVHNIKIPWSLGPPARPVTSGYMQATQSPSESDLLLCDPRKEAAGSAAFAACRALPGHRPPRPAAECTAVPCRGGLTALLEELGARDPRRMSSNAGSFGPEQPQTADPDPSLLNIRSLSSFGCCPNRVQANFRATA